VENNQCIATWNTYAGLQGYSIYTVSVAAQTAVGTGPSITVRTDRTPEGGKKDQILRKTMLRKHQLVYLAKLCASSKILPVGVHPGHNIAPNLGA